MRENGLLVIGKGLVRLLGKVDRFIAGEFTNDSETGRGTFIMEDGKGEGVVSARVLW